MHQHRLQHTFPQATVPPGHSKKRCNSKQTTRTRFSDAPPLPMKVRSYQYIASLAGRSTLDKLAKAAQKASLAAG
eukprot:734297-Pleurochrysis_carterae.AAC.7